MTPPSAWSSQIQVLLDRLRQSLSPHRQLHVMGVAHTVTMLAARHGLDMGRAMSAGLLHDLYKEWSPAAIREEIARLGGSLPEEDLAFPSLWHGLCAALLARVELEIDDPDIYEAVMLHTTADAHVGPLTRALFVADFAEPGRRTAAAPDVLAVACQDLEEGFRRALQAKALHMQQRGKRLSVRAVRALLAYLPPEMAVELATVDT